jgi:hypothetical protein
MEFIARMARSYSDSTIRLNACAIVSSCWGIRVRRSIMK